MPSRYCCEDVALIEGYIPELERTQKMVLHHRLESHDSSGNLRAEFLTMSELKELGMYYSRLAKELIWLTETEHKRLHANNETKQQRLRLSKVHLGKALTEETKSKLRAKATGKHHKEATKQKIHNIRQGSRLTESVKSKIRQKMLSKHTQQLKAK